MITILFYKLKKNEQVFLDFWQLKLQSTSLNVQVGKNVNVKSWKIFSRC